MEDKIFYVSYCKAVKRYIQKVDNKELKQRRRRPLRKRPWKKKIKKNIYAASILNRAYFISFSS